MDAAPTLTTSNEIDETASRNAIVSSPLLQTQKITARIQFWTLWLSFFLTGWNDASLGPLLPRIGMVYHVGFMNISFVFVCACVGFIGGAVINIYLTGKLGFGKILVLGSLLQTTAYAIQSSAPPFPLFVMTYSINAVGVLLQEAQINGFVTTMKNDPATKMGILYAGYGLGGLISPFVATQFAQLPRWSFHFLISFGIAFTQTILFITVFKFKGQDECLLQAGEIIQEKDVTSENSGAFKEVFTTPAVHLIAFFILFYVGVEVTMAGWIVTYIIDVRGGGPSSGYISAGFFGGIIVGRVGLLWINKMVGERRVLFIYILLAIGLEISVWFIPSLVGNAVAVAFISILLGPIFPLAISHSQRVLPRQILTSSIGWIAGFGQAGGAVLPFVTGAIASRKGIQSLQPLLAAMTAFMLLLWVLVPNGPRHTNS